VCVSQPLKERRVHPDFRSRRDQRKCFPTEIIFWMKIVYYRLNILFFQIIVVIFIPRNMTIMFILQGPTLTSKAFIYS